MLSSNNNSEIDIDITYTKYGKCRCCMVRGHHRDLDKEYYFNNIKEVYRDIFAKCYNLLLSQHSLISSLICENCVQRLRDASSFRMMVAASEELLLNTVIFKNDPENHTDLADVRQNFTTDVKIENNLDIIRMLPSPDVFQDESESPIENEQVNVEGWVNDNERTSDDVPVNDKERNNDDVPLNDKERMNDNVPLNDKEGTNDYVPLMGKEQTNEDVRVNEKVRVNDEERMNDDDGWSDDFDDRMSDDDGWSYGFDDPTNDDVPQNDKERTNDNVPLNEKERTNDDFSLNHIQRTNDDVPLNDKERTNIDVPLNDKEQTNDDVPLKDKERTNAFVRKNKKERVNDEERMNDDDGWSDDFDGRMNDDDGWSDGSDDPMNDDDGWSDNFDDPVNYDIRINHNGRTNDDVPLNDKGRVNDDDGWSDVFADPMNDDDNWSSDTDHELVIDEDRASSSGTDHILTNVCDKTVKPKSIERVFKTKTPKEKDKSERETKTKLPDKQQALEPSSQTRIKPKTLSDKQALAASIADKIIEPKSIKRVSKTKLPDKQAPKPSILEKLLEPKTKSSDKQALAAYSIPKNKLIDSKSIGRISKTIPPKTKLSVKRAPPVSIPENVVESKTKLSDKQALPAILIISMPDELAESKPILLDKQALLASIPNKLVEQNSMERVSKTETLSVKEKRAKAIEQKHALAVDATTLFEFSNATAFKNKNRNGYPCFYCREVYKYNRLKEHQEDKHAAAKGSIYTLLSKYHAADFVVYAEITDLKCTICKSDIKDLYELREHLSKNHGKDMYKIPDRVIPFKLQEKDFECQICGRIFETFGLVGRHMNTHFGTFVCQICGTPFITKHRLAVHTYSQHKNAKEKCKVCKKSFATYLKMRVHYETVHEKNKTIHCTKCPEIFLNYFSRMQHLAEVHGAARHLYQCDECEKGFTQRTSLHDHLNRCHMQEIDKKLKCDKCSFECYTKSELWDHKLIHSPQEFECDICKKVYTRRRSLAMHFKRKHMTRV